MVKNILSEEECGSVGKAGGWWSVELAVTIAVKPPSVMQETLGMLEENMTEFWRGIIAKGIKSKLCST